MLRNCSDFGSMSRTSRLARHRARRGLGRGLGLRFVLPASIDVRVSTNECSDCLRDVRVRAAKYATSHRDHTVFACTVMLFVSRFDEKLRDHADPPQRVFFPDDLRAGPVGTSTTTATTIAASEPRATLDPKKSLETAMTPTSRFRSMDDES
jgi:hypothetical protein